jgi:hypothetical protein
MLYTAAHFVTVVMWCLQVGMVATTMRDCSTMRTWRVVGFGDDLGITPTATSSAE